MSSGGFNLRKWRSNSRKLQMQITKLESSPGSANTQQEVTNVNKEDDKSFAKSSVGCDSTTSDNEDAVVKILGMNWNTLTDEIFFNFSDLCPFAQALPLTKRSVLKVTAKIFDPMGFLTPLTIEMKILFQELCINKTKLGRRITRNFASPMEIVSPRSEVHWRLSYSSMLFFATTCNLSDTWLQ